ncbi:DUF4355 domain-containing protein [Aneurinibacillus migulanus]|uniref:DUF4355 domain-containing protein n=1 Tax=Aneurinibacillus migulanus TaxID=47500 RepID=UPI00209DB973|nr:DUF4355 domain-containing protein [Aneurinibacillus migulanus]MCP1355082.1 DUF4355 domain-containing protein [Aneurinibacillus migulanus]
MNLEEIKQFLNDNKDNPEVKTYLDELAKPTKEGVEGYLKTYEGQKVMQPHLDKHFTKGLETWKQNNLEKLIDEEVQKRNPQKTPEQIELEKLRKEIEDERKSRTRQELVNKALKVAKEKNLPDGVIDFFIADDEENTLKNLETLEKVYSEAVQKAVDSKFKEHGRDIDQGRGSSNTGSIDIDSLASEASIRK